MSGRSQRPGPLNSSWRRGPHPALRASLTSVDISIATYKRPTLLRGLLEECLLQADEVDVDVHVIVVDNDRDGSAAATVACFAGVEYICEARPGIAAARNRGLRAVSDSTDGVIFIDDDEIPAAGWLSALLAYADSTGADVVTGPVEPLATESTPEWVILGGFWQRGSHETGHIPVSVATNNTLLRMGCWRSNPVWFSEELSMKGGSDTEFFRQLRSSRSVEVLFCADAVVREYILPERANVRWLFRRAVRIGNINGRYRSRVRSMLGGIARVMIGAPLTMIDLVVRRHYVARSFNMLAHGMGMIGTAFDLDIVEYQRTKRMGK